MKKLILLICISISSIGFGQFKDKAELKKVSTEILSSIKKHSIVTDSINWKEFKSEINNEIERIPSVDYSEEVISKIFNTLAKYGDHHSFYSSKTHTEKISARKEAIVLPTSKIVNENIGYLHLPTHSSINKDDNYLYADTLRKQIKYLDENYKIKGWIVDLRDNSGGNMWPMLAGLNPLIEDGTVGYFVTNKTSSKWISASKNPYGLQEMKTIYKAKNLDHKIAVLLDRTTASSGEMTAISLSGLKNSKTFGNESGGYTTANGMYELSDGSTLFLASSYCQDRNKKIYMGKIQPDVRVDNSEIMQTAQKWIKE